MLSEWLRGRLAIVLFSLAGIMLLAGGYFLVKGLPSNDAVTATESAFVNRELYLKTLIFKDKTSIYEFGFTREGGFVSYKDGVYTGICGEKVINDGIGVLNLDITDAVDSGDVVNQPPVYDLVWKATIADSTGYISFLLSNGASVLQEISTQKFVEYFLEDGDRILRVVVLPDYIIVGHLSDNTVIPELSAYLDAVYKLKLSDFSTGDVNYE